MPGLTYYETRYPAGLRLASDSHDYACFVLNRGGTIREEWPGGSRVTGASVLTFMLPGQDHAASFPEVADTFEIILRPSWLERIPGRLGEAKAPLHLEGGASVRLAERMYREFARRDDLTPLTLEGLTLELLAQAARDCAALLGGVEGGDADRGAPRWLARARDFLHAHYKDGPALESIADAAGVHSAHLTRSFRRHFGCTLGDYARRLRVEHACRLLRGSDMPLSRVAAEAGFSDQAHLCRAFKAATGTTPARFRNETAEGGAASGQETLLRDNT